MNTAKINLEQFRTQSRTTKSRVFTGRDRGKEVREKSKFDELFENSDKLEINIPNDIFSITPSFLEELLYNMVSKYGKEKVLSKLSIKGTYDIDQSLAQATERILQEKNGLQN